MPTPRKRFRIPIMMALVGAFAGTTFFGVAIALWLGLGAATENTLALIYRAAETGIDDLIENINRRTSGLEQRARWVADRVAEGRVDPTNEKQWQEFLSVLPSGYPRVAALALIDEDFQARGIFARTFEKFEVDLSQNFALVDEINLINEETPADWTPPLWYEIIGEPFFVLKQPLYYRGEFKGVFVQLLSVSDISQQLRHQQMTDQDIFTPFVLYTRDKVLAHPSLTILARHELAPESMPVLNFMTDGQDHHTLPALTEIHDPILRQIWSSRGTALEAIGLKLVRDETQSRMVPSDSLRVRRTQAPNGETHHIAYKEVSWAGPATLVVGAHYNTEILEEPLNRLIKNGFFGLTVLVLSVGVAVIFARLLARRARSNAAAAAMVGEEDLDNVPLMPPSRIKEIDDLTHAFNEMVKGLKERTRIRQLFGRYVPNAVAQKLLTTNSDDLEAETVVATVSFTDMEGFTALSERLDPTDIVDLLNSYFEVVSSVIERHGGIITQFQGDAILAIYNAPVELPDHELAAVQAAREIYDEVSARLFAGHKVACRTGITTGQLVSGSVGAPERRTYTVHGDVVNTAARLEAMNKQLKTRILIGPTTAAAVRGKIELEAKGQLDIRGRSETLPVYCVPVTAPAPSKEPAE